MSPLSHSHVIALVVWSVPTSTATRYEHGPSLDLLTANSSASDIVLTRKRFLLVIAYDKLYEM